MELPVDELDMYVKEMEKKGVSLDNLEFLRQRIFFFFNFLVRLEDLEYLCLWRQAPEIEDTRLILKHAGYA